jgi:hypothetical protein
VESFYSRQEITDEQRLRIAKEEYAKKKAEFDRKQKEQMEEQERKQNEQKS